MQLGNYFIIDRHRKETRLFHYEDAAMDGDDDQRQGRGDLINKRSSGCNYRLPSSLELNALGSLSLVPK